METEQLSRYIDYLPAYLQTDPVLGQFLLAFEQILSGSPQAQDFQPQVLTGTGCSLGLETVISQVHSYLDPQQTPVEFLPWLAGWVALALREDWNEKVRRSFISQMVPLYQIRGTVPGLKKMLQIYLESSGLSYPERTISIFEFDDHPHYFQVQLALPSNQVIQPQRYWQECRIAKAIIDQEKPAHTFYALRILTLTMQLTRAWGGCFPFLLFDAPPQQKLQIEASVKLDQSYPDEQREQQILIRIQGKTSVLEPNGSQLGPTVRQTVFYEKFLANPDGFLIALANLGEYHLKGTLAVKLNFNLNQQRVSLPLFESPFSLEPNLRIYRPFNHLERMPGNTRLDADPQPPLRLQPPLSLHQPQIQPIDGNTHLNEQVRHSLRLVHDARLRIYLPRPRFDRIEGGTRLGSAVGATMRLSNDPQTAFRIYRHREEHRVGNTKLEAEIGQTMRLVPNSQWLERLYRFSLFDAPGTQKIEVEALIEPEISDPIQLSKAIRLLIPRMQSCTSAFKPFTPNLEFLAHGILATQRLSYRQFLDNPRGFYVVLTNVNDFPITGKITIKLKFNLNQSPASLVVLAENFSLSPRDNVLEICHSSSDEEMAGNTIIGRMTPQMLKATTQVETRID